MAQPTRTSNGVGPQVIFGFDATGRCTLSMGPGLEALGTRPHELEGQDLFQVYADDPTAQGHLRAVLDGETFTVERDFQGRVLSVFYQPMRGDGDVVTGAIGVATDITDQRRLEREMESARSRAGLLADLSQVLARSALDPGTLLPRVVRAATEPLGDVGVLWVRSADSAGLAVRALWDGVEARLVTARERPVHADRELAVSAAPQSAEERLVASEGGGPADELLRLAAASGNLLHVLRVPLRSRGHLVGLVDIARRDGRDGFGPADTGLATEVAERCALALDNAVLLDAERESYAELVKFKALAEASHDLIAISDEQDQLVYANPRVRRTGLSISGDVWAAAELAQIPESFQDEVRTGLEGEGWSGDVTLVVPGGKVTTRVDVVPLFHPVEGQPLGAAWIGQDVTELRETEAALRATSSDYMQFKALVESSSDFIAIADLDGRVAYLNPGGRELIGLPSDLNVATTVLSDYLAADQRAEFDQVGRPTLLTAGHWATETALHDHRGGSPIPVVSESFLMRDVETDEPFAIATVQRDITERLASERALRELADQRQALLTRLVGAQDAERTRIAADVHDDPVQACAAVELRIGLLLGQARESSPDLLEELESLQSIVHKATSRLRALLFDLEPPALDQGLRGALSHAAAEIFEAGDVLVEVDGTKEPDVPDATQAVAYRIVKEALTNVRKHASARHVAVTIAGRDGGLLVHVSDDGIGVGGTPIRSEPGHRGVAGMQDRALAAGGRCTVADRDAGGTEVSVWLPGRHAASADAPDRSVPAHRAAAAPETAD